MQSFLHPPYPGPPPPPPRLLHTVHHGLRRILRTNQMSASLNDQGWYLLSRELNHMGYRRHGFRCSVIANHIHNSKQEPFFVVAGGESMLKSRNGRRNQNSEKKKRKRRQGEKREKLVIAGNGEKSDVKAARVDPQRIQRRISLLLSNQRSGKPKSETSSDKHKKQQTTEDAESSMRDKKEVLEEKRASRRESKQSDLRLIHVNHHRNNGKEEDVVSSTLLEPANGKIVALELQLNSIEREMTTIRDQWLKSMKSSVDRLKLLQNSSSKVQTLPVGDYLPEEIHWHQWQKRHQQLVEQEQQLLRELSRLRKQQNSAKTTT